MPDLIVVDEAADVPEEEVWGTIGPAHRGLVELLPDLHRDGADALAFAIEGYQRMLAEALQVPERLLVGLDKASGPDVTTYWNVVNGVLSVIEARAMHGLRRLAFRRSRGYRRHVRRTKQEARRHG